MRGLGRQCGDRVLAYYFYPSTTSLSTAVHSYHRQGPAGIHKTLPKPNGAKAAWPTDLGAAATAWPLFVGCLPLVCRSGDTLSSSFQQCMGTVQYLQKLPSGGNTGSWFSSRPLTLRKATLQATHRHSRLWPWPQPWQTAEVGILPVPYNDTGTEILGHTCIPDDQMQLSPQPFPRPLSTNDKYSSFIK